MFYCSLFECKRLINIAKLSAYHLPTVQSRRQMSEWIAHSKELFTQSLAEVGQNHQHALDLQTQHQHFTANCMVRPTALR